MSRAYPSRPVVAVGAIVVKAGKVLLVRRRREPSRGLWSLPGGAVRRGEGLREAVAREVREECGIDVRVEEVVEVMDRIYADRGGRVRYHYVIIDFLASWRKGRLQAASDISGASWVDPARIGDLPLTAGLVPVITKALRLRRRRVGGN
ncbi:MAG: NUDIX hydrolase [candidate division NC10 bacterium CSP1-5]|nr:MAG: NUDIX hydrolase [candidate division NC10 bacterium CSP1-5]